MWSSFLPLARDSTRTGRSTRDLLAWGRDFSVPKTLSDCRVWVTIHQLQPKHSMGHWPGLRRFSDGDKVRLSGGQVDTGVEGGGAGRVGEEHLLGAHHLCACWLVQCFHGIGEACLGRQSEDWSSLILWNTSSVQSTNDSSSLIKLVIVRLFVFFFTNWFVKMKKLKPKSIDRRGMSASHLGAKWSASLSCADIGERCRRYVSAARFLAAPEKIATHGAGSGCRLQLVACSLRFVCGSSPLLAAGMRGPMCFPPF